jgi:hypothetical protein
MLSPPMFVIQLPIEAVPQVMVVAASESEEQRLKDWITSNAPLHEIVDRAIELAFAATEAP